MSDITSEKGLRRAAALVALLGSITMTLATFVPAPAAAADNCGAQFSASNAPDDASCVFTCKARQQLVIGVDASDGDATASGSARCGGGYSPCRPATGTNSCYGEEGFANSGSSSGSCSAVVDELWNSAWSYNCLARDPPAPCATPPCDPKPGQCIFNIVCCPPAVCGTSVATPTAPAVRDPDPARTRR